MSIKIHNSLTDKKEEFKPLNPQCVGMYVCGPTVYDVSHIGHLRAAYVFDFIRRYLEYRGYNVKFVRNITDVDDKIINRASEEIAKSADKSADLKQKAKEVAEYYTRSYEQDMRTFGIKEPDIQPKATEHIQDMIVMIKNLIEKGFAYEAKGDVYFSVRKFSENGKYGKLSRQSIDQMMEGVRMQKGTDKKDPLDFALWKSAKENEPSWDSPWGKGRPGWHIECSVMSTKYLKSSFDIHGGGRDLIFPHHENEIAQAEAATGKEFARYWIHNGLLTVDKEKMAKSLGNYITLEDFLKKYKDADLLKLVFLSAHYSSPVDFSEAKVLEAKKQKKVFYDFFDKVNLRVEHDSNAVAGFEKDKDKIDAIYLEFQKAMDDDFNTARALAYMFEMVDLGAKLFSAGKKEALNYAKDRINEFFEVFGLKTKGNDVVPEEVAKLLRERYQARKEKNFEKADALRKKIEDNFLYTVADSGNATSLIFTKLPEE
ncbi:MAG: cysteine--tRNA ligase [Candidatus Omnitrophica bacterium]|nr:cysteine--tRNA ligase [Candidatus Omnitrophota bacterium]